MSILHVMRIERGIKVSIEMNVRGTVGRRYLVIRMINKSFPLHLTTQVRKVHILDTLFVVAKKKQWIL